MSRTLWAIAELAWRQLNPKGKDDAKNTVEEYVETAIDEYAQAAFQLHLQIQNEKDLSLIEGLLRKDPFDVKRDDTNMQYSELDKDVLDLPRDLGIFQVKPNGQRPLAKVSISNYLYFNDDPGDRTYYRVGRKIYYPDGFALPNTSKVWITYASTEGIGPDLEIPDILASRVRDGLLAKYGGTVNIPQDTSNNREAGK